MLMKWVKNMESKLKAYTWKPDKDDENCLGVVAESSKEARKIGYIYWRNEYCDDNEFIDCRVTLNKEAKVEGLLKGVVEDMEQGLKLGFYGYVEGECPRCGKDGRFQWDNGFFCWNCEGQELCPKCSDWTLDSTEKKCSECDKNGNR